MMLFLAAAIPLVFTNAVDGVLTAVGLHGTNECSFLSQSVAFQPGELGLFSVEMRAPLGSAGGCTIGSDSVNADVYCTSPNWMKKELVFVTPSAGEGCGEQKFHLGQWHMDGTVEYRNPTVTRVRPVFRGTAVGPLGHDEVVEGNVYRFCAPTDLLSRNFSRPLLSFKNVSENHNRWVLNAGAEMTFRFALPGRVWRSAEAAAALIYPWNTNAVELVASNDGRAWRSLGLLRKGGRNVDAPFPKELFPAKELFVRFREFDGPAGLQVPMFRFEGRFDGEATAAAGATVYVDAASGDVVATAKAASLYDDDYGETLGACAGGVIWAAPSYRKVWRHRAAPTARAAGLRLAAAANEAESVQLVVKANGSGERGACENGDAESFPRRESGLIDVRVACDGAIGPIPAANVEIFRVGYVRCAYRSDGEGMFGWWPDPLHPQNGACAVPAGENQPFWVRVKVPAGTPAGTYAGKLTVTAGAARTEVPLTVEVYGFELPRRPSLPSAFGLGFWHVNPYQHLLNDTPKDLIERVHRKYLESFAEHRLAPQEAWSGTLSVEWKGDPGKPAEVVPVIDFTRFDRMMAIVKQYDFNAVNLSGFIPRDVLGGGAGGGKYPAAILGYRQGTPEHTLLAEKYVAEVAKHVRANGWTDLCYVYLYDEPEVETYPHVRLLSSYWEHQFPEVRRLITEQPAEGLKGGPNLWCPETHLLRAPGYRPLRRAGDGFWWYICAEPTCPFAAPFIDHPGIDLRVWIWQTWANDIGGILFWDTTYWNAPDVYASPYDVAKRQDPYADPAGWAGVNKNFGNGDGRFLYPPEGFHDPTRRPVEAGPVESIRWEVLRDGMEDYEYFALLKRCAPQHPLLAVPAAVTDALESYARDGAALERHRAALAAAIEMGGR